MNTTPGGGNEAGPVDLPEWEWLELAVKRLLESHDVLRRRTELAEMRIRELEGALEEVSAGRMDPVALAERAEELERENQALEARLANARETVQRILARLRFAEEES